MSYGVKAYLDNCSLQRPLDSRIRTRVILDAEAVLGVLGLIESGKIELISSDVLTFEISRTPNSLRRAYAFEVLLKSRTSVSLTEQLQKRAAGFVAQGIKPLDALHVASAEEAGADYFCTCNDKLLKKAKTIRDLATQVVAPLELIEELEQ